MSLLLLVLLVILLLGGCSSRNAWLLGQGMRVGVGGGRYRRGRNVEQQQ